MGRRDGVEPQEAQDGRTDGGNGADKAGDGERLALRLRNAAALAVRVRERLESDRADLAHWQAVRVRQLADGTATDFGRHNVAAGDRVQVRGHWYPVVRANVKTVFGMFGMFGLSATPWQEVQAHAAGSGQDGVTGDVKGLGQPLFTGVNP